MSSTRSARATFSRTPGTADAAIVATVDAFRRILRELRIVARQSEVATGLTSAQLFVLCAVAAAPGCSVKDVAQATMTDRSSVAAIVDRLVEEGYVKRAPSREDRRRASITITPRGRRATGRGAPAPTALLLDGLDGLESGQLRGLARGLVALTERMGIADKPAGMLFEDGARHRRRGRGQRGPTT